MARRSRGRREDNRGTTCVGWGGALAYKQQSTRSLPLFCSGEKEPCSLFDGAQKDRFAPLHPLFYSAEETIILFWVGSVWEAGGQEDQEGRRAGGSGDIREYCVLLLARSTLSKQHSACRRNGLSLVTFVTFSASRTTDNTNYLVLLRTIHSSLSSIHHLVVFTIEYIR